jgi:hypothetical protein
MSASIVFGGAGQDAFENRLAQTRKELQMMQETAAYEAEYVRTTTFAQAAHTHTHTHTQACVHSWGCCGGTDYACTLEAVQVAVVWWLLALPASGLPLQLQRRLPRLHALGGLPAAPLRSLRIWAPRSSKRTYRDAA